MDAKINQRTHVKPIKNKHRISNMYFFLWFPRIDFLDFYTQFCSRLIKLVCFLQVQPQLRAGAEEPP